MLRDLGLVVVFAIATAVGLWHAWHSGHMCFAQIKKVAKLIKQGDPPKPGIARE